jgi:putative peptidoglycan lipid II flippase
MTQARALLSASMLITSGMVISRIFGLLREILLAAQFGTGSTADMAIMLLLIPDFITAAFIGTAVSAVLIPAFHARSEAAIQSLTLQTMLASFALLGLVAGGLAIYRKGDAEALPLFIAFLSMPFGAATAALTAYLQHHQRFLVPAWGNVLFNVVLLAVLMLAPGDVLVLACGIMAATLARLAAYLIAYRHAGGRLIWEKEWHLRKPLLVAYVQAAAGSISNSLPFYAPYLVVHAATAGLAAFSYAFKLLLFPSTMVQTIIQLVLLPWLVRQRSAEPLVAYTAYSRLLRMALAFSLACSLAFALASHALAELCFGYGRMTPEDIALVGELMRIGIWCVPGAVLSCVWQQIFFSHQRTRTVMLATGCMAVMVFPLVIIGQQLAGLHGVMLAYVLTQLIPFIILAYRGHVELGTTLRPSASYARMAGVIVLVFAPLALLYEMLAFPALPAALLGVAIGLACLLAGLAACPDLRQQLVLLRRGTLLKR